MDNETAELYIQAHKSGATWPEWVQTLTREELLSIIRSTNPKGAYRLARIAAMDEWDHRYPVGAR